MSDVISTFGRCEECERGGHQGEDLIKGAWSRRAEKRFQFRERHFDRIEVGTVRRQETELRARGFDRGADLGLFVDGEVVEDDHIARPEGRDQDLFHVGEKARGIERAIEHRRRSQSVGPQRGDHGLRLPMPAWRVVAQPDPAWTAAVSPQQIRGDAAFIEEDILAHVAQGQPVTPATAISGDVGPSLFVGVDRFF